MPHSTMHVAVARYDQAIAVLHEVVRLAPNLPDSYHTLGLVYSSLEDYRRAMDFYMIAAHLTPKNSSLWKLLFTRSMEQGDIGQASYCLSKAITADPKDIALRSNRAVLDFELGDYQKAAVAYEQVHHLCCENVDALNAEAKVKLRIAQKQVAEENKRKAIMITTEKAELAASEGKPFCITRVDVGLDVAAVREAVTKVVEQKEIVLILAHEQGLYVMVFSTDESTNKVVVCAGELDKGKLDVSEWLSNALGPLKVKCDKEKGVLATGQGTDASHVNEAIELAASFASMKFS